MKKRTILLIVLIIIILIAGIILAKRFSNKENISVNNQSEKEQEQVEVKKIKIVNEDSKTRPYAVMINNNHEAWPQCGLQDAYIVYEIIAEGGITRMMALYKDQETAKIGSVRSARHYFIDYAEENDAIFVHWGGSPQAYSRISSTGIDNLDGMALEGSTFFRDKKLKRAYEHTGFTSMGKLKETADKRNYTRDTNKDLLLNYSVDELEMKEQDSALLANSINIEYSDYHSTSYEYDLENKVYKRSMSGKENVDLETGIQYTAKNIIIYQVQNYTLNDGENKGRQEIKNIGSGERIFCFRWILHSNHMGENI